MFPVAEMSFTLTTSLALFILCLSTSTIAAPTRTHCRCTVVSNIPPPAIYTPASAHWAPSEPSPSPSTADVCFNLGAELENVQHTHPDLFDFYVDQSKLPTSNEHPAITTALSLNSAAPSGLQTNQQAHENGSRPTSRPHHRVVCQSEVEPFSAYQSTFVNLWALQIIIAVAVFACLAEGIHIGIRWMHQHNQYHNAQVSEKSSLRLAGAEKRLLAIPTSSTDSDQLFSPGAEKKLRAYASTRCFVTQSSSGRREFIAYEEEDDDEMNRPVM